MIDLGTLFFVAMANLTALPAGQDVLVVVPFDVEARETTAIHAGAHRGAEAVGWALVSSATSQAALASLLGVAPERATEADWRAFASNTGTRVLVVVRGLRQAAGSREVGYQIRTFSEDGAVATVLASCSDGASEIEALFESYVRALPKESKAAPARVTERAPMKGRETVQEEREATPDLETASLNVSSSQVRTTQNASGQVEVVERDTQSVDLSAGGVGFSAKTEKVERVKEPAKSASTMGVSFGGGGTFGDGVTIATGLVGFRYRSIWGSFPGTTGGSMVGLDFATDFSLGGGYSEIDAGFRSIESGMFVTRSVAELAVNFMTFGEMDDASLRQNGFGLRLGAFVGANLMLLTEGDGPDLKPTYGPLLAFEFPSYNAGTAKYSSASLNFIIIPGSAITFFIGFTFEG